jgi:hypothetical protein
MISLAITIVLLSAPVPAGAPDPLFEPAAACAVAGDALFPVPESTVERAAPAPAAPAPDPPAPAPDAEPRSLVLAAASRVNREDPSQQALPFAVHVDLIEPSARPRVRLESPGRAWPFALAATADAATTYWALGRGGAERNPLLALGRADVGMVKMLQFPLLAKAVDMIGARDPRLGRRLRWATLAFHALLAFNNVRMGRMAGELGLDAQRHARRP